MVCGRIKLVNPYTAMSAAYRASRAPYVLHFAAVCSLDCSLSPQGLPGTCRGAEPTEPSADVPIAAQDFPFNVFAGRLSWRI